MRACSDVFELRDKKLSLIVCIFFRITNRVKSLLNLIPTDPAVSDALDHVGQRVSEIF